MKKTISKKEAQKQIEEFFENVKQKTAEGVKKIRTLAMAHNIKLGSKKKPFCDKCFKPYITPSIRINKGIVTMTCDKCGHICKWKMTKAPLMPIDEKDEDDCEC